MKLLPIEGCRECRLSIFNGIGYVCTHSELVEKHPKPEDRRMDYNLKFLADCPLEDVK